MTALAPRPPGSAAVPAVVDARPVHSAADLALSDAARAAVLAGMPESTRRAYARDWSAFTTWCAERGRVPLPATAETVTEYVTFMRRAAPPPLPVGKPGWSHRPERWALVGGVWPRVRQATEWVTVPA
ncbi:hypothetical protein SAMN05421833_12946 [Microbispora rosea]|uniref:Phage integrase, N-terminal SAM-like domain n=1 Tax=Microbispora rosea TaxID=58117 RepID=A0A1N7GI41_9ACTN|nr:hypothetical protein [Microbispora rosea]GIH51632.1 hypothetical protein Mro03_68110 [Microbispora rosea subsp. rosea]SIS12251.1 hypothetical protein SAMN05421833_12946 [Microbispora rosea]